MEDGAKKGPPLAQPIRGVDNSHGAEDDVSETLTTETPRARGAHIRRGTGVRDSYGLTPKRRKFVKGILSGKTATDAYADAFNSKDRAVACALASRLIRKESVRKAIDAAVAARLSPENVIANFVRRANYDPADLFDENGAHKPIADLPVELRKAIKKIEVVEQFEGLTKTGELVKIELHDSIESNVHLAKLLALTGFKQEKGVNVQVNVGASTAVSDFTESHIAQYRVLEAAAQREAKGGPAMIQTLHDESRWTDKHRAIHEAYEQALADLDRGDVTDVEAVPVPAGAKNID